MQCACSIACKVSHVLHACVQEDCPVFAEGADRRGVLQAAAMATKWWEPARDALDTMILNAAKLEELSAYSHLDFMPFDATVKARAPCLCHSGHLPRRVVRNCRCCYGLREQWLQHAGHARLMDHTAEYLCGTGS